jgi:hypothetical protein
MFTFARYALRLFGASILALGLTSSVGAQNVNNMLNLFGGMMRSAVVEGARAEWRNVRPVELACIEDQLQQQGTSAEMLAQQGTFPNDGRVAGIRVLCARATMLPVQIPVPPVNQPTSTTTSLPPSPHPTFDCAVVKSALGSVLCAEQLALALFSAVGKGELTPGQATEVGRLLETYVRLLEPLDFDARLRRLEERHEKRN